jgi:hypothetical protein
MVVILGATNPSTAVGDEASRAIFEAKRRTNTSQILGAATNVILGASSHDDRNDAEAAEADLVPITKLAPTLETNGIFVVEGAVCRTEIMQDKPPAFAVDRCVMRGRRSVCDFDVELLPRIGSADAVSPLPKRPELPERIVLVTDEEPSKRPTLALSRSTTACSSSRG